MSQFDLRLTPLGHLMFKADADAVHLDDKVAARLAEAFSRGSGPGLLRLGAGEIGQALPPVFLWWRDFAARYVAALCFHGANGTGKPASATLPKVPPPAEADIATLLLTAPMMAGAEYLSADVLLALWDEIGTAFDKTLAESRTDLQSFLKALNPAWNLVGRVHFNLAENRGDPAWPFAFMATYTTRLSSAAKAQHVPLGQALRDYSGAANREALLSLLLPVQRAAEHCDWLRAMVEAGEIFHPLRWTPGDAARLLSSVPELESAGVIVRMPPNWRAGRPARARVTAKVGAKQPSLTGLDGLLDFDMDVTLEGEPLTEEEVARLLHGTDSLVLLRGQWVEVDQRRLDAAMRQFHEAQELAESEGLTFAEAMRLLAGATLGDAEPEAGLTDWSQVIAGPWLAETLKSLRSPDGANADPGPALKGTLRPYQKAGVQWLRLLSGLGLGACLADDMGLGKTIQVLSLLLILRRDDKERRPSLLVAPASLLANWAAEIDRFAPDLAVRIVHPSAMPVEQFRQVSRDSLADVDLAITSYGSLLRVPALAAMDWRLVILDEAQAIKNPGTKQSKAAKALKAKARIALTGTPVENHLGDLWSIFDFINPGLLGSARQFSRYTKGLTEREHNPYGPLRDLVRPYILRRMKTDKAVIADLPDKTEVTAYCPLSRKQAALYAQTVSDLADTLGDSDGIQRKGIVLASLMRLKQICNHPSQWLNDNVWAEDDSGKMARLREIATTVAARQEKMLVFTQFREMTAPLAAFLGGVFGRPGVVLHGQTPVKDRKALVKSFQEDENIPFFVLTLKAGGSGLTLTAASHVVHFDRWWNAAAENQATDRAFRIGQKKNVLVHKFVCRGTVEEKIDALIDSKKDLSDDVLTGSGEVNLTEMTDDQLLQMVTLDLSAAMRD
ncbi:DEAD/DEAH box helicase [Telmatospirillum sp.]|uniref:DEAD/DEAH box helicase n=1 Tax=Telmatospirillum sp. TaxID=2079197 RepID=UPI0028425B75|nr:DEAD/DEAH box helicase [Telmatospirillum sp.]MDR3435058.1 DEAD/DEAH box helicase [Telmatospirillum sp.]